MAWTYTNSPSTVERDAVRLLVGDVLSTDPQLTDEEIAWFLTDEGSVMAAAVVAAQTLQALYARKTDQAVGDLRVNYSQRSKHYADLVKKLESRRATRTGPPFAGGISAAQKETVASGADRVEPAFEVNQFYDGTNVPWIR